MTRLAYFDATIPHESFANKVIALIVRNNSNIHTLKVGGRLSGLKALVVSALWPQNCGYWFGGSYHVLPRPYFADSSQLLCTD